MSAPRNHIGIGAASIRPTRAPKSSRALSACSRSLDNSSSLSLKSKTQINAAPAGETLGSASVPRKVRALRESGGTRVMAKGAALFWVRRTCAVSVSSCASSSPPSACPLSSLRYSGIRSRPSHPARRSGASIRPSARTSKGTAGDSSIMRDSRRSERRVRSVPLVRALAFSMNQPAIAVHAASSRPIMTKRAGDSVITDQLCRQLR